LSLNLSQLFEKLSSLSLLSSENLYFTQCQIETPLKDFELQVLTPFRVLENLLKKSIADDDQFKDNFGKMKNSFIRILSQDKANAHKIVSIDRQEIQIKAAFDKAIKLINNYPENYTNEVRQQLDIIFNRWYDLKSYKQLD